MISEIWESYFPGGIIEGVGCLSYPGEKAFVGSIKKMLSYLKYVKLHKISKLHRDDKVAFDLR